MDLAWGDRFNDETQGLDIAGVRGLDQSLEAALVNGITTISQRGRYFTILPWAIGEFFSAERANNQTAFDEKKFGAFLSRVEFLVLACTTLDEQGEGQIGALGRQNFQSEIEALSRGENVAFPSGRSSAMLGTYFGPCRALGLLRTAVAGSAAPLALTPRGTKVWTARGALLGEGPWRKLIWEAESLASSDVKDLSTHFSLRRLGDCTEEAAILRDALLSSWAPSDSEFDPYKKFNQTIEWLRRERAGNPLRADVLLTSAWRRTATGNGVELSVEEAWGEYEWRRRLHYALELMLSAVADSVRDLREATLSEVVDNWLSEPDLPSRLISVWPEASIAIHRSSAEAATSVPREIFLAEAPPDDLSRLSPHARALTAFALIAGLAWQSADLRKAGRMIDRKGWGERLLATLEEGGDQPFQATLLALADIAVKAHFETTFRKMGGGQKCSLRFFPEGSKLLTTGLKTVAGRSGSRLWNVIRVLEDAMVPGLGGN